MKTFKELKLMGIGVCIFEFTSRSVSTFMKYFRPTSVFAYMSNTLTYVTKKVA